MKYTVIQNGKSLYHIVGANLSDSCERYAASQLQHYLYECTGTFIPYFSDRCPRRTPEILIGADTRDGHAFVTDAELDALGEEGFLIRTLENGDILITGKSSRGTLYGVYEFLRRFCGFRAFTKDVERIHHMDEVVLPPTELLQKPAFEYRDAYFRFAFDGAFCAKNRLNTTLGDISAEKGGSFKFFNCHHSFDDLVPPKRYFDAHPEYFAEWNGARTPLQPCLSHPDVLRIATEQVKAWIAEHPECRVFSVAQNDKIVWCQCPDCRRADEEEGGTPAGSIIRFVNHIAKEIEREHPQVLIHTFAYQYSRRAPHLTRPHRNVIVRLCNIECEWGDSMETVAARDTAGKCAEFLDNIREWSQICNRLYIWDYAVNFHNYLQPFPNFYTMAENIRFYKAHGVRGVLEQGNFSYGGGAAMDDLKVYLISHLLWDTDADVQTLIDEFTEGVYGRGAPFIREYIALMSGAVRSHRMTLYDHPDADYLSDALIERADELFDAAERAAESEEIRARIRREHLSVRYLRAVREEDAQTRAEATDRLAADVRAARLTEIMERTNLEDSFRYMKASRYAKERPNRYLMYYIVR
ncbi:MAG: DUF4838 domain-containing protein [Clostridia bacterium]|nr:DUF4838 domain-containing protein [Clostridia bacterium]